MTLTNDPSPLQGLRVWIVDDNETNCEILKRRCESWGMIPRVTTSAMEALRWANKRDACDLVLVDNLMPEMSGLDLAKRIHNTLGTRAKQVMLSSAGHLALQENERGVLIAQLVKPIKHSILFETLLKAFDTRAPKSRDLESPNVPEEGPRAKPLRILVAEDNPLNIRVVIAMLSRLGHRADVAGNGLEAIEALQRQPYDVILMDVQMPEMDGIEATRRICAEWPSDRRPRIIALTAGVLPEERQACLDAGMDAFLQKPIVKSQLVDALGTLSN